MRRAFVLLSLSVLASCAPTTRSTDWAVVHEVTPPFLLNEAGADPALALDRAGRVALTWVRRDSSGGNDLWVSIASDSDVNFSEPVRVNPTPGRVSSYSESRPVAAWGRDGQLLVAWAQAREGVPYADDIALRASPDGGRAWGSTQLVNADHGDPKSPYHGFIALESMPDGRAIMAWIDGRDQKLAAGEDEPHVASIWSASSADGGATWGANVRVARDVCPCCRPALRTAPASDAPGAASTVAVAYRGAHRDLRDPRMAFSTDGGATFGADTLVSADRWWMPGCPAVGLGLTFNRAGGGHVAWYTGESPRDSTLGSRPAPGIYVAPWRVGAGAAGIKRMIADSLDQPGRPLLAPMGSSTLVGALGRTRGAAARKVLAVRALELDGTLTPWLFLGNGVKSGAIAGQANRAWAAWVETNGEQPRVRVARIAHR